MESNICYIYNDGIGLFVPDALWVNRIGDKPEEVKFGYLTNDLKKCFDRSQGTFITQFYNLVVPGLIVAKHIFEGLDRPLYCDDNKDGDHGKRVYTWRPRYDYAFNEERKSEMRRLAPEGKVFAVIVTPNIRHVDKYPNIKAWIDRWTWIDEDNGLDEAPVNWVDRYETKIWTRE